MAIDLLSLLIRANLAAAAAILLVVLIRRPMRAMAGARIAYGLWLAAPIAALAGVLPARVVKRTIEAAHPLPPTPWTARPDASAYLSPVAASPAVDAPAFDPAVLALGLWLVGALCALALVAYLQRRSLSGLGRLAPLAQSRGVFRSANPGVGPAVVGGLFPRIVLPADFETRFSPEEQAVILAHERSHLDARDAQINAATVLAQCLFWFNPLIHLAAQLLRLDQELACDAAVMARHPQARRTYAEALLKGQLASAALPLGCYWPARGAHPLKLRFEMLARSTPPARRRLLASALLGALVASSGIGAWAAQPARVMLIAAVSAPPRTQAIDIARPAPAAAATGDAIVHPIHRDLPSNPGVHCTPASTEAQKAACKAFSVWVNGQMGALSKELNARDTRTVQRSKILLLEYPNVKPDGSKILLPAMMTLAVEQGEYPTVKESTAYNVSYRYQGSALLLDVVTIGYGQDAPERRTYRVVPDKPLILRMAFGDSFTVVPRLRAPTEGEVRADTMRAAQRLGLPLPNRSSLYELEPISNADLQARVDKGDKEAAAMLFNHLYFNDPNTDPAVLQKLYEQSEGMREGPYALGMSGVIQVMKNDPVMAAKWNLRAAEAGDRWSTYLYAKRFTDGNGVPKDPAQALVWYRKAAVMGSLDAIRVLQDAEPDPADRARWSGMLAYREDR